MHYSEMSSYGRTAIEYLGSGAWSDVYREIDNPDRVITFTSMRDKSKECIAVLPEMLHVPYIRKLPVTELADARGMRVGVLAYETRYYADIPRVGKLMRQANALEDLIDESGMNRPYTVYYGTAEYWSHVLERMPTFRKQFDVSRSLLDAAMAIIKSCADCNPGGILLDIKQENMGQDTHGNLVLRDLIFLSEER